MQPPTVIYVKKGELSSPIIKDPLDASLDCAFSAGEIFSVALALVDYILKNVEGMYGSGLIVRGNYPFNRLINVAHYFGGDGDYTSKKRNAEAYREELQPQQYPSDLRIDKEDLYRTKWFCGK
eukprot:Nk52_evm1s1782 gene=Nk52_evmTU1s1782